MQGDSLGRHWELGAAELVGPVVAENHVLEPQQQLWRKRLAGQVRHAGYFLVEHLYTDDQVADELSLVGIGEGAVVAKLADLADVVEKNAGQQQVAVELGIKGQKALRGVEQGDDVFQ